MDRLARVAHPRTSAAQVPARVPGKGKLKVIEAAPGAYARIRADGNVNSGAVVR